MLKVGQVVSSMHGRIPGFINYTSLGLYGFTYGCYIELCLGHKVVNFNMS